MENTWKERSAPQMRPIKGAMREIKQKDPHTAFSETRLRKLINRGVIPALKEERRYLVDMNVLYAVLGAMPGEGPKTAAPEGPEAPPEIEKVEPVRWFPSGRGRSAKIGR